jgi:hypothetical protein
MDLDRPRRLPQYLRKSSILFLDVTESPGGLFILVGVPAPPDPIRSQPRRELVSVVAAQADRKCPKFRKS